MNLSNAFGKFGALMVDVVTFVRASLANVSDDFAGWLGTDDGKASLRSAVEVAVKSIKTDYEKSVSPEPKVEYVIDFDSAPKIVAGFTIAPDSDQIASRVRGKRNLSDIKVRLHLDDDQKGTRYMTGYDLKPTLEGHEVYGAQLLDFYLEHPDLIPEDWKIKGLIFFWGTIYRDSGGRFCVRYLSWSGTSWISNVNKHDVWDKLSPAAVSASTQV